MRRGEGLDGTPFDETMDRRVDRDPFQKLRKYFALKALETALRRLNEPDVAGYFGQDSVAIVPERAVRLLFIQPLEIGEPFQVFERNIEPISEFDQRADGRNVPVAGRRSRRHLL